MRAAAETARRALDILDRDGWCKYFITAPGNPYENVREGSHCLGGAWNLAHHDSDQWAEGAFRYLAPLVNEIMAQYGERPVSEAWGGQLAPVIAAWNNSDEITECDVRRVLEKIAAGEQVTEQ